MLSLISIITLSSFGMKESKKNNLDKKPVRLMQYWFHCADGSGSGTFTCDCDAAAAQSLANFFC